MCNFLRFYSKQGGSGAGTVRFGAAEAVGKSKENWQNEEIQSGLS